jgi:uncharacterized membrane protein
MSERLIHICRHCGGRIPYAAEDAGWDHVCPHCEKTDIVGVSSEFKQAGGGKVTGEEAESVWVFFLQVVAYLCLAIGVIGFLIAAIYAKQLKDDFNQGTPILVILTPAIVGVIGCVTYLFFSHLTKIFERIEKHLKKLSDKA